MVKGASDNVGVDLPPPNAAGHVRWRGCRCERASKNDRQTLVNFLI